MNDTTSSAERTRRLRQSQLSKQSQLPEPGFTRLGYTMEEAATVSAIGRTNLYKAAKEGRLRIRKAGRRSVVTPKALEAFIESLPERDPEAP